MNGVTCGGRHMCWVKMPRVYTIMGKQAEQNLLLFCLGHRLNRAATNHTGICEAGGAWIISVRWQKPAAAIDLKRRAVIPPNHIMLAPLPGTMEKERQPASLQRKGKIDRQQVWIRAVIQCKAQDFSLSQYSGDLRLVRYFPFFSAHGKTVLLRCGGSPASYSARLGKVNYSRAAIKQKRLPEQYLAAG